MSSEPKKVTLTRRTYDDAMSLLVASLEDARMSNIKLKRIVTDLYDDSPCDLDHHGSCQAHNWFGQSECPHARAEALLK